MTHVITRACCNDAACTLVCPVACIHPAPEEAGIDQAEMLHIDPDTCIDCGVCVVECPVGAIYPAQALPEALKPYQAINAALSRERRLSHAPLHSPFHSPLPTPSPVPLRVAIVGSGPAGCYAALELLDAGPEGLEIDIYERLPTPWGLVRYGVAPDHQDTRSIAAYFAERTRDPRVRFIFNVEVGEHVSAQALASAYDAVIYAHGASATRRLGIEGEDLSGCHGASSFVAWYNGHPDALDHRFDLSGPRAVIVGNGNVALDMARMLTADRETLQRTDIAPHALAALGRSGIREVVIVGRRGAVHAACTSAELLALSQWRDAPPRVGAAELALTEGERALAARSSAARRKLSLFQAFARAGDRPASKAIRFRFLATPARIEGATHVQGIVLAHSRVVESADGGLEHVPTGASSRIETSLVLCSVGYQGKPLQGLPFDPVTRTVPSRDGRVLADGHAVPGAYAVGWIKRGPSGVIGTNKRCAQETVAALLADAAAGRLPRPTRSIEAVEGAIRARSEKLQIKS